MRVLGDISGMFQTNHQYLSFICMLPYLFTSYCMYTVQGEVQGAVCGGSKRILIGGLEYLCKMQIVLKKTFIPILLVRFSDNLYCSAFYC